MINLFLKALGLLEEKKDKIFQLISLSGLVKRSLKDFHKKNYLESKKNKELKLLFYEGLLKNEDGLIVLDPRKVAGDFTALRDVLINFNYLIKN